MSSSASRTAGSSELITNSDSGLPDLHEKQLPPPDWMDVYILHDTLRTKSIAPSGQAPLLFPLLSLLSVSLRHSASRSTILKISDWALRHHSISCKNIYGPWTGLGSPTTITFSMKDHDMDAHGLAVLHLGRCSAFSLWASSCAPKPHWAKTRLLG